MKTVLVLGVASAFALGFLGGCSDDDDNGNGKGGTAGSVTGGGAGESGASGAGGGGTGGTGGGGTGGLGGGGMSGTAGMAGEAGMAGGAGMAGQAGMAGAAGFWPNAYDPNCTPPLGVTSHFPGMDCMTCHTGTLPTEGGFVPQWLFGGTVYQTGATTGAEKVEVGVWDGTNFYYTCSDNLGNFFYPNAGAPAAPNWATADTRIRNASGEKKMQTIAPNGACNSAACHGTLKLLEP
jgi:hypothetical protein